MRRTTMETNQEKWTAWTIASQVRLQPSPVLFVGHPPLGRGMAPCVKVKGGDKQTPIEMEGDTHTHTHTHALPLRGAPSHNLNSHLNEGRKDRKRKRKRARRKDRSSEKH